MEENKPKIKKVVIIAVIVIVVAIAVILVIRFLNKSEPIPVPTEGTGAVLSSPNPSEDESYKELYALMDRGEITTDYFKIVPIYQDRTIQISVKRPLDENKDKAEMWLNQNGYSHIPSNKIYYFESVD